MSAITKVRSVRNRQASRNRPSGYAGLNEIVNKMEQNVRLFRLKLRAFLVIQQRLQAAERSAMGGRRKATVTRIGAARGRTRFTQAA